LFKYLGFYVKSANTFKLSFLESESKFFRSPLSHRCIRAIFRRWKASLIATRVVLLVLLLVVVVTPIRKMPKAFLIRNGKLRNLAYTFVTSLPPGLPS